MFYSVWRQNPGIVAGHYRLTLGRRLDTQAMAHRAKMRAAGYLTGPYGVIVEYSDIVAQAELFVDNAPLDDELPDLLDAERDLVTEAMLVLWCDVYDARSRRKKLWMYTGWPWWTRIRNKVRFSNYGLMIAGYPNDKRPGVVVPMDSASVALRSTPPLVGMPAIPSPWPHQDEWQYTGQGSLPGYSGFLDLGVYNGSEADLRARFAVNQPLDLTHTVIVTIIT